jgi:hypothetical protein
VPYIARQIPIVSRLFERSLAQYERHHGHPIDFGSWYWRPPLAPAVVVESERRHIERRLDCPALVSLTDHDTQEGPKTLRAAGRTDVPLSLEWSVRFEGAIFHLGVHAIAEDRLEEAERTLAVYRAHPTHGLGDILEWLVECPETFIVLNHPYWDLARVGGQRHDSALLKFLRAHHNRIHALEINGYRTWAENRRVLPLAEGFGLPIAGGGDRHGRTPNSIVNLTSATSLAEFARDLRAGRATYCVVFRDYVDPYAFRLIQSAGDCMARDDGRTWSERTFSTRDGVEVPLNALWNGAPWWLTASLAMTQVLGSSVLRPLYRLAGDDGFDELESDLEVQGAFEGAAPLGAPRGNTAVL